ncbi:putative dehydrogenase/threonine dehydrogenase-like Zn-dependent dehydrogenase [Amorphus suaedae]
MKQVLQSLRDGRTEVADVPVPLASPGHVLIRTERSLVSAGTERMLVEFGKGNLIEKARQQPDKVRQVLAKVRTDGIGPTMETVRAKLDQPLALGYCNAGTVIEVGTGVVGFVPGDRVASNGKHAEIVSVPANLCAKIPDGVSSEAAAFTVAGAIALQGIRLVGPTLGETVVVTGLGLIGLMAVQLLRSHGARVLGIDYAADKLALARSFGAETVDLSAGSDPVAAAVAFSRGRGVDAVLVTASTKSNEPMHQAALMCRQRGRIVLVGVTGLELSRADFYEKELTFQVSCSYGPGRYDADYEERGHDYPVGFVRWTEQRNFEAVLDMLADGRLDVGPLISHRFAVDEAEAAYAVMGGSEPSLGIVFAYPAQAKDAPAEPRRTVRIADPPISPGKASVGFVGSGSYATKVLIPAFKAAGAGLGSVASASGVSGLHAARKFGFADTTTDTARIFDDAALDTVVITTRHDSHAQLVLRAIEAGKHVFVEKPLCLTEAELDAIEAARTARAAAGEARLLMVGFNRRFAPLVVRMKALLTGASAPKAIVMTVNAGAIPADHWTQDPAVGGGRIIGEACHFVDLVRHLAGAPIVEARRTAMASATGDTVTLQLAFEDGSIGTVHYFANGHRSLPKERVEVFSSGCALRLDNFRSLTGHGWKGFRKARLWNQDKGQRACAAAFVEAVRSGGPAPIPFEEIAEVTRTTIALAEGRA